MNWLIVVVFYESISMGFIRFFFTSICAPVTHTNTHTHHKNHIQSIRVQSTSYSIWYVKCEVILMINIYFFPSVNFYCLPLIVLTIPCTLLSKLCWYWNYSDQYNNQLIWEIWTFQSDVEKWKQNSVFFRYVMVVNFFNGFAICITSPFTAWFFIW